VPQHDLAVGIDPRRIPLLTEFVQSIHPGADAAGDESCARTVPNSDNIEEQGRASGDIKEPASNSKVATKLRLERVLRVARRRSPPRPIQMLGELWRVHRSFASGPSERMRKRRWIGSSPT